MLLTAWLAYEALHEVRGPAEFRLEPGQSPPVKGF